MRVNELMSDTVVTVTPETPLKDVAELLLERGISGAPVCDDEGVVVGVVSEADIVSKERGRPERPNGLLGWMLKSTLAPEDLKALARTAGEAMTAPAITIAPYRSVTFAAKLMLEEQVNRLPVVNGKGQLVGLISRADLVRAFARADAEIAREIREDVLRASLWTEPDAVGVEVHDGSVSLTGQLETKTDVELLTALTERVPGVVAVESDVSYRVDNTTRQYSRAS